MRIAYLILAHNTPNHLARLVQALDDDDAAFFIHLDARSDISRYRTAAYPGNVRFLESRVRVWWGEFSMVRATLLLLEAALAANGGFDYCVLLSGSDYPIVDRRRLREFFQENHGSEFINVIALPSEEKDKSLDRLAQFRFQHNSDIKLFARITDYLNTASRLLGFRRDPARALGGMQAHAGSQWWALTGGACRYLLDFIRAHREVAGFFENTRYPDESLFQTIIANSPFRDRIRRNLTYADWEKFGPPFPATLNEWHMDLLRREPVFRIADAYGSGQVLFARKFPDDSEELIGRLRAGAAL